MSGKYSSQLDKLYPDCYRSSKDGNENVSEGDGDPLQKAKDGLGDRISEDDVTNAKSALKHTFKD